MTVAWHPIILLDLVSYTERVIIFIKHFDGKFEREENLESTTEYQYDRSKFKNIGEGRQDELFFYFRNADKENHQGNQKRLPPGHCSLFDWIANDILVRVKTVARTCGLEVVRSRW